MKRTVEAFSLQGKNHVNQDMYGMSEHVYFVFDGATSLFGDDLLGGNDVQRCMKILREYLLMHAEEEGTLKDILKTALQETRTELFKNVTGVEKIPEYALPTFALAMVRFDQEGVDYFVLADCEVYADGKRIRDPDFFEASKRNAENTERILKKYNGSSRVELSREAIEEIYALDKEVRKTLNTPQGYWVGSLDGKGLDHAVTGRMEVPEVLALYCDGYAHLLGLDAQLLKKDRSAMDALRTCTDDDVTLIRIEVENDSLRNL